MKFFTRYNWRKVRTPVIGPSRTEQHHKQECDINFLLKRIRPAELREKMREAVFIDTTAIPKDAIGAMEFAADLQNRFAEIPISLRQKYGLTPSAFVTGITAASKEDLINDRILPNVPEKISPENKTTESAAQQPEGQQAPEPGTVL